MHGNQDHDDSFKNFLLYTPFLNSFVSFFHNSLEFFVSSAHTHTHINTRTSMRSTGRHEENNLINMRLTYYPSSALFFLITEKFKTFIAERWEMSTRIGTNTHVNSNYYYYYYIFVMMRRRRRSGTFVWARLTIIIHPSAIILLLDYGVTLYNMYIVYWEFCTNMYRQTLFEVIIIISFFFLCVFIDFFIV